MLSDGHLDPQTERTASTDGAELGARLRRANSLFVFPTDAAQLFEPLTELMRRASEPFKASGEALRANMEGLLSTVTIPYRLAYTSVVDGHWQRIHTAAGIRSLKLDGAPGETLETLESRRKESALAEARPKMETFVRSDEGQDVLLRHTLGFLESLRSDESLVGAAEEIILQGLVLCWGAFEVFARDCFVAHLNANPSRALALQEDSVAKRRFELSKISLETLAIHGFDLSGRMGTLLAQQQDLSDVYSIKAVYQALFPTNNELRATLETPDLRLLSVRRNLIVHRRGIIDETYAAATNCSRQIGERLGLTPADLDAHIRTTMKTATSILAAASI